MTLDDLLGRGNAEEAALAIPDGPTLSYDVLRSAARAVGATLAERGFPTGARICASYANGAAILVAFFGVAGARMGFAPLNAAYTEDEFRFYLEDIAPAALLLAPDTVPAARAAAEALGIPVITLAVDHEGRPVIDDVVVGGDHDRAAQDDDIALFLHTSGTTSRPKGVPLSHGKPHDERGQHGALVRAFRERRLALRDAALPRPRTRLLDARRTLRRRHRGRAGEILGERVLADGARLRGLRRKRRAHDLSHVAVARGSGRRAARGRARRALPAFVERAASGNRDGTPRSALRRAGDRSVFDDGSLPSDVREPVARRPPPGLRRHGRVRRGGDPRRRERNRSRPASSARSRCAART